jgi:chlorite dismutase
MSESDDSPRDDSHNPTMMPPRGSRPSGEGKGPLGLPSIDVRERGADRDGAPQVMDRRLFMQLLVFRCDRGSDPAEVAPALGAALESRGVPGVIYEDVNDPRGIALLTWGESPATFVDDVRPTLAGERFRALELRPELTMLGRSYSSGFEEDLEFWVIRRPKETALNTEWPWAVWYPLRRGGHFEQLDPREQGKVLKEHAIIGRAYGAKDLAHDIRLACHGLDQNDNEFVIGLVGKELHPLSHVVQTMRKTKQTSEYIVQMGPFFVGRATWRSAGRG